jgi:hypothetical protein
MSDIVNLDDHVDQEPVDPDNIKTELADVIRTLQEILALPSTKLMCKERVCWMITYLSV